MPRPRSDITNSPAIGVRVTVEEYEIYKKLGGGPWLRAYLQDIAARRKEDAQANTAHATATERVVAVRSAGPAALSQDSKTNRLFR